MTQVWEYIKIALMNIRSNKGRSILTMLGIIIGISSVIMIISMFIQTKLNPTPPDPIQAKVMMMMPFMFGIMFLWFPAGLVLYWVVNNVLSIAQQWQITRMIESAKPGTKVA